VTVVEMASGGGRRLQQLLAQNNIASKREAERYIREGWVQFSEYADLGPVGRKARDGSVVIAVKDGQIRVESPAVQDQVMRMRSTFVLNKPYSFLSHEAEKSRSRIAKTILTPCNRMGMMGKASTQRPATVRDLHVTGRLDSDSTGVLIFTRSGVLSTALLSNGEVTAPLQKEYLVRVSGAEDLSPRRLDTIVNRFRDGSLELDGSNLQPARVKWLHPGLLQFVLTEGKFRQIRRMCDLMNLTVVNLKRVRVAGLKLGRLPVGKWRPASIEELFPNEAERQALLPLATLAIRPREPHRKPQR
jgi:23S rRNA pseudouridine2604 synthase